MSLPVFLMRTLYGSFGSELCVQAHYMRLLNADSVQFSAWNRENETYEKRRKFDMVALQTETY